MPPQAQRQIDQIREWLVWVLTLVVGVWLQSHASLLSDVRRIDAEQLRRTQYTSQVTEAREDIRSLRALTVQLATAQAQGDTERRERLVALSEQMIGVLKRLDSLDGRVEQLTRGREWGPR